MKHSSTWFALILIALALFLNAARSVNADSPSPRPTNQPNKDSALAHSETAEHPTPIGAESTEAAPRASASGDNQQKGSDAATDVIAACAFVTLLATIAIAKFNKDLVSVTDEMKQATADAAQASKDSARAAEESARASKIALQIDRPFIVVESVQLKNFWPASRSPGRPVLATFALRNHGKGTAINPHVRARLDIVNFPLPKPIGAPPPEDLTMQYPELGQYYGCEDLGLREQAIPAGSKTEPLQIVLGGEKGWSDRSVSFLSDNTFSRLVAPWDEKRGPDIEIVLHILVLYKDVSENSEYPAESIWNYFPSRDPEIEGKFVLGFHK